MNYIIDNSRGYISFANSVPPILKNSLTYISITDFDYALYRFLNVRDEKNNLYEITYNIYDKSGYIISDTKRDAATSIIWQKEPPIFENPYSDFLISNISAVLNKASLEAYSFEYMSHIYNDNNDKVDFRYKIKSTDNELNAPVLKMSFEKNGTEWRLYHSEIE